MIAAVPVVGNPPVTLRVTAPFDKGAYQACKNLKSLPCEREGDRRKAVEGFPMIAAVPVDENPPVIVGARPFF